MFPEDDEPPISELFFDFMFLHKPPPRDRGVGIARKGLEGLRLGDSLLF